MLDVILVTGANAAQREAAIATSFDPECQTAIILEGIASGLGELEILAESHGVQITRIAPGCLCCVGNLTLRVTLNRLLKHPPQRLFISIAANTHLSEIGAFLAETQYQALLILRETIFCE